MLGQSQHVLGQVSFIRLPGLVAAWMVRPQYAVLSQIIVKQLKDLFVGPKLLFGCRYISEVSVLTAKMGIKILLVC